MSFIYRTLLLLAFLCASMSPAYTQEVTGTFSESERVRLSKEIGEDIQRSQTNKSINQGYDIASKIAIFLLAALAAGGAAWVSILKDAPAPAWLKTTNLVLTSLVTLTTTLSFTQFNFSKRQLIWETRYQALRACDRTLNYTQANSLAFLKQLEEVQKWNDETNPSEQKASCNADVATTKPSRSPLPTGLDASQPASAAPRS